MLTGAHAWPRQYASLCSLQMVLFPPVSPDFARTHGSFDAEPDMVLRSPSQLGMIGIA
jgi:hypothetical protein